MEKRQRFADTSWNYVLRDGHEDIQAYGQRPRLQRHHHLPRHGFSTRSLQNPTRTTGQAPFRKTPLSEVGDHSTKCQDHPDGDHSGIAVSSPTASRMGHHRSKCNTMMYRNALPTLSQRDMEDYEFMVNNIRKVSEYAAQKCRVSGCNNFGNKAAHGFCNECHKFKSPPVHGATSGAGDHHVKYQGHPNGEYSSIDMSHPSASRVLHNKVKCNTAIYNKNDQLTLSEEDMEAYECMVKNITIASKTAVEKCRVSGCDNFGNKTAHGLCNKCYTSKSSPVPFKEKVVAKGPSTVDSRVTFQERSFLSLPVTPNATSRVSSGATGVHSLLDMRLQKCKNPHCTYFGSHVKDGYCNACFQLICS